MILRFRDFGFVLMPASKEISKSQNPKSEIVFNNVVTLQYLQIHKYIL